MCAFFVSLKVVAEHYGVVAVTYCKFFSLRSHKTTMKVLEVWPHTLVIHVAIATAVTVGGNGLRRMYVNHCIFGHNLTWLFQKHNQCPICRARLIRSEPLIPNIAMDSLIEKHIEHLSSAGDVDWQPHGSKYKERASRKE